MAEKDALFASRMQRAHLWMEELDMQGVEFNAFLPVLRAPSNAVFVF